MSAFRIYRRLFANERLGRVLLGELVGSMADWIQLVALLVVVYADTDSPLVLGLVGALRIVPFVLLSVPAGVIADRFDRRRLLIAADLTRAGLTAGLAWLVATGGPVIAMVGLSFAAACAAAIVGPAIGAFMPDLVRDETELGPANATWAGLDNVGYAVGPAVGGVLLALAGPVAAFALASAAFLAVASVMLGLPARRIGSRPGQSAPAELVPAAVPRSGMGEASPTAGSVGPAVRSNRLPLVGIAVIQVVECVVGGGLGVLTVIVAADVLHADESVTGYLNAALGIGGLVGVAAAGVMVLRQGLLWPLVGGCVVTAIGVALVGLGGSFASQAAAFLVASAGTIFIDVVVMTLVQRLVPPAALGRAVGLLLTAWAAGEAVGALAYPGLVTAMGLGPVLLGSAIVVLLAGSGGAALIATTGGRAELQIDPRIRHALELPLFDGLPAYRLEATARRLEPVAVRAGLSVIRQGDPADTFYVVVSGRFEVRRVEPGATTDHHLRDLGPDDAFGEIGLLRRVPRTATVTAATDGVLLALDGAAFLDLVGAGPGFGSRLSDLYRGAAAAGR